MNAIVRRKSVFRLVLALVALAGSAAALHSQTQSAKVLTAPTFYIAASAEYVGHSELGLDLKGVSNLPPGARLSVTLHDYLGYKSSVLSQDAIVILAKDGFFEINLKPRPGKQLKENMVCVISFDPNEIRQDESVLNVVGRRGELLGGSRNPQVGKKSGENFYLWALVHIP